MINLIRAELLRLVRRRVTLFAGIALLAITALFLVSVNVLVTPPSAADVADARASYQSAHDYWEQNADTDIQDCVDQGETQANCELYNAEPKESDYVPQPATFADAGGVVVNYASLIAMMVVFVVAASSMGAEYGSGAIANWLTFVPERLKVFGSKLVAVALAGAVALAVVNLLSISGAAAITSARGGAVTGVADLAEIAARSVVLGVFAAVLGLCLAILTRHTVAALGILVGYLIASQVLAGLAFVIPTLSKLPPWLPSPNIEAFRAYGSEYSVLAEQTNLQDYIEPVTKMISFTHGAVYLAVLLVVFVVGTGLLFRRRDVT